MNSNLSPISNLKN